MKEQQELKKIRKGYQRALTKCNITLGVYSFIVLFMFGQKMHCAWPTT